MAASNDPAVVGTLPDGGWVGLAMDAAGYRLTAGGPAHPRVGVGPPTVDQRSALIALAIVYFEETLPAPPDGTEEATHRDMAGLLGWLAQTALADEERRSARLVLDAIEDGLPGDAVAVRLMEMLEVRRGSGAAGVAAPVEALDLVLEGLSAGS